MRISSFRSKRGQEVALGSLTVFVGANNAGKSRTLADLSALLQQHEEVPTIIVDDIQIDLSNDLNDYLSRLRTEPHPTRADMTRALGLSGTLSGAIDEVFRIDDAKREYAANPQRAFRQFVGKFFHAHLTPEVRLQVSNQAAMHDTDTGMPETVLGGLWEATQEKKDLLKKAFRAAFGEDLVLDDSRMINLQLRIVPEDMAVPEGAREKLEVLKPYDVVHKQGHGYRSFSGVLLSVIASNADVLLLDEPEAFLHPEQVSTLARWLSKHATESGKQLIVATHDARFLSALVSSAPDAVVVRVNRKGSENAFVRIDSELVKRMSDDPIMSSQRVIDAVFSSGAIVCEADSDRGFYEAVLEALFGVAVPLVIHAHDKAQVAPVLDVLRKANVRSCGVIDIDVLNNKRPLSDLLAAGGANPEEIAEVENIRRKLAISVLGSTEEEIIARVKNELRDVYNQLEDGKHDFRGTKSSVKRVLERFKAWEHVKKFGIEGFDPSVRDEAKTLLKKLQGLGLFAVPVGELEGWVDNGIREKKRWYPDALGRVKKDQVPSELAEWIAEVKKYLES